MKRINDKSPQNQDEMFEFEGATVDEAIKNALTALKVSRRDIEVKILSEESKGLFGMQGSRPAKIKVKILKKTS